MKFDVRDSSSRQRPPEAKFYVGVLRGKNSFLELSGNQVSPDMLFHGLFINENNISRKP